MNGTLDITSYSHEQFLDLRKNSLGGSDVGTILGLNQYKSAYELWSELSGVTPVINFDNSAMFMGRYLEDKFIDLFEYWENFEDDLGASMDATIKNFQAGAKQREVIRVGSKAQKVFIQKDYLHASPDARYEKTSGEVCGLEIKTINSYTAGRYVGDLPPAYYAQIQHYLMLDTEAQQYTIFMIVNNGSVFKTYTFQRDEEFIAKIKERAAIFWEKVTKAREALASSSDYEKFAPNAADDNQDALYNFLKKGYQETKVAIQGKDADRQALNDMQLNKGKIKVLEAKNKLIQNTIVKKLLDNKAQRIEFSGGTYASWTKDSRGTVTFRVKI